MGCDIHGVFQAFRDGQWVDVPHSLRFSRQYKLFGALCGVRLPPESCQPCVGIRGYPKDFEVDRKQDDHETRTECLDTWNREYALRDGRPNPTKLWMGDHSHTWATGDELMTWWKSAPPEDREHLDDFFGEVEELILSHRTIRFVFGFDS